ncbi:hypothetical protein [Roseicella aerolata]|uniref:Uncharacterized protein n=1 Tax=Roseicella aerolata TaxID=2883479 RepID=A0A9X1IGV4_9PROT|nr:hypothetical protein [Roseicella aerolata]MCB4824404.1 hypothetical protein [Roseicella aerolata]
MWILLVLLLAVVLLVVLDRMEFFSVFPQRRATIAARRQRDLTPPE